VVTERGINQADDRKKRQKGGERVNGRGQQGERGQQQEQTGRTDAREQRKEQGKGRWSEWNREGGRRGRADLHGERETGSGGESGRQGA
jgi:hypothetical protein